jgi:hypothetical protein
MDSPEIEVGNMYIVPGGAVRIVTEVFDRKARVKIFECGHSYNELWYITELLMPIAANLYVKVR